MTAILERAAGQATYGEFLDSKAQVAAETGLATVTPWHDLEAERHAIAAAVPEAVSVWGSQDLDAREQGGTLPNFTPGGAS